MFGKSKDQELKQEITRLEIELEKLKARKATEEQEIKHMIKMKEERNELELEKEKAKIKAEANERVAQVKNEYRDKMEERLIMEGETIKRMYYEILQRLPNVTARLKSDV